MFGSSNFQNSHILNVNILLMYTNQIENEKKTHNKDTLLRINENGESVLPF